MTTALSGIRVLDLSRILAGPWATQTLADLGADVIKVERPGRGDDTRTWGPPYQPSENSNAANESAYFLAANRGKKSIALDITSTEGQLIIRELIESTDILVENFKVGGLKKYGLDYERLRKINPRLIYCSITGFGQTGPYSHRPGYDFMLQGMGGLMSITGEPDNHPGGGPVKVGVEPQISILVYIQLLQLWVHFAFETKMVSANTLICRYLMCRWQCWPIRHPTI